MIYSKLGNERQSLLPFSCLLLALNTTADTRQTQFYKKPQRHHPGGSLSYQRQLSAALCGTSGLRQEHLVHQPSLFFHMKGWRMILQLCGNMSGCHQKTLKTKSEGNEGGTKGRIKRCSEFTTSARTKGFQTLGSRAVVLLSKNGRVIKWSFAQE